MDSVANAAPTTAPSSEAAPVTVESLNSEQRSEWLKTGNMPAPKAAPTTAQHAPSEDESIEDESASASASEAEKTSQEQPQKPRRSNAEQRIKELLAENKRLKAEKSPQAVDVKTAEPSPAKPAEAKPKSLEAPKKPKLDEFDSYDKYEAARDQYYEDMADFKAQKALVDYRTQQAQEAAQRDLQSKLEAARGRKTDYDTVAGPALQAIATEYEHIHPLVREMLDGSPVIADALYVLGGDEEGLATFISEAKTSPAAAARRFALIENLIQEELGKGKPEGDKGDSERNDKGQFTAKPEKQFSSAPPPVKEVGAKATAPTDEAQAALDRGDGAAYRRIMNARELAARKG